ncbi:MAG: SDR family NAD(P)-dependent oxidoreductase [Acidimicrobiales bacterium]
MTDDTAGNDTTSPPSTAPTGALAGRRVLVVGASAGIGRSFAAAAAGEGAMVAVSARRPEPLDELVAGGGAHHAFVGDAAVPADARRVADEAAASMGGLDLVMYAAGYGVLQRLVDTDPEVWTDVYRVNVVGANVSTAAALPHLGSDGVVAYLSSRTADDCNALFTSYSASKAALDQCIRAWRIEHPDRRFVRIVMGNCQPTEFANQMNLDLLGDALEAWERQAIPGGMMHVDDVGLSMARSLGVVLAHPDIDSSELKLDARTR